MFDLEIVNSKKLEKTSTFTSVNQARCYRELMFILKQGDEDIFKSFLDDILEGFMGKTRESINVLDVAEVSEFNRKSN